MLHNFPRHPHYTSVHSSLSPFMLLPRTRRGVKLAILIFSAVLLAICFPNTFSRTPPNQQDYQEWLHNKTRGTLGRFQKPLVAEEQAPRKSVLGKHRFRTDGLVEVNEEGAHPIYELISRSEAEWAKKHERASKTFDDAVEEYRRRYKRAPPKGFDLW